MALYKTGFSIDHKRGLLIFADCFTAASLPSEETLLLLMISLEETFATCLLSASNNIVLTITFLPVEYSF